MGILSKSVIAALAGLFVVSFAPVASAQVDAARNAIIHKCIVAAQKEWPNVTPDQERMRTDAYLACMQKEGQRP